MEVEFQRLYYYYFECPYHLRRERGRGHRRYTGSQTNETATFILLAPIAGQALRSLRSNHSKLQQKKCDRREVGAAHLSRPRLDRKFPHYYTIHFILMAITFVNGLVLCVNVVKELYVSLYDCGGYYFVFVSVTLNVSKTFWPAIRYTHHTIRIWLVIFHRI